MNKLKKSLKKSNRGILLAFLLIVIVVIYTAVDNYKFKSEKPVVADLVTEYIEGMGEYMIFDDEYITTDDHTGNPLSTPKKEELKAKWNSYVEKYWLYKDYSNNYYFYGCSMIDTKDDYNDILNQLPINYVDEYKAEVENVKVKKAGPECATAEVDMSIVLKGTKDAYFLTPCYNESLSWYGNFDENGNSLDDYKKYAFSGTFTFNLERVDGEWKITGIEGYLNSSQEITISADDIKTEGGEV